MTGQPDPRSVAVFGSCITRDNFNSSFNPAYSTWYTVPVSANQTSVIALMSPPIESEVLASDGLNSYDEWNVHNDLGRNFLADVVAAQPDYLVLDFFGDVHFGVLRLTDGRYATDNRWKLHRTALYARWRESGLIAATLRGTTDREEYFALWTEAMDRFAAHLAEHCPRTRVILHRGFYTGMVVSEATGRPRNLRRSTKLAGVPVKAMNELWDRLDDYALSRYGWDCIDLRGERYTSDTRHRWRAFWVHYTADYYHRFLGELHLIDVASRSGDDVAAKVAAIGEAGRARLVNQVGFTRRAVAAQDQEIRRLQSRGPLRSLRESLRPKAAR